MTIAQFINAAKMLQPKLIKFKQNCENKFQKAAKI